MKRRRFIASTALAGMASVGLAMNTSPKQAKSLLHHVFFWLKNPNDTADKKQLIEGLKTLAAIPTVKQIHVGLLASTEKRDVVDTSWDVSELLFFEDEIGQKTYQDHPIHQDFIKKYSHLWQKVVVYDAIDV
ncbi:Dabb family protein [Flavobacterium sp. RSSB_23]|uniref:Dabb family protein n=1 Tax=Flavobacterium sp. RSSB_23 TaxID=3447668 RepID=UPI003F3A908B